MGCRGTRAAPPAPTCISRSSKLNSSHSKCMTSASVMLSLMEKKGVKLDDVGAKSLLAVLKSRSSNQKTYHTTAAQPEAGSWHSPGALVQEPPCTWGRMMTQPREEKHKLRNAHSLPSPTPSLFTTIARGTQISVPWYDHLSNGKSTVSPPGREA